MKAGAPGYVLPEDYLRLEAEAVNKPEYFAGEIRAMAAAESANNRICFNLNVILGTQFDGSPCAGYTSDQRVQVLNASSYLYPDLSLVCGQAEFNNAKTPENLLNPTLLVEVLSASTASAERGEKFTRYRQLPSLH